LLLTIEWLERGLSEPKMNSEIDESDEFCEFSALSSLKTAEKCFTPDSILCILRIK